MDSEHQHDQTSALAPLPIRMLNEHAYCPRLFYLMHVQGQWAPSTDTVEGTAQHERAGRRQKARAPETETSQPWPAPPRQLELASEVDGIVGKLDALEEAAPEGGSARSHWAPVEAKHSSPPSDDRPILSPDGSPMQAGAWPNDQMQLGAQAILLRAAGYACEHGFLFYRGSRERVKVDITDDLVETVRDEIRRTRETEKGSLPPPLVDSPKCKRCSLNSICLPFETNTIIRGSEAGAAGRVLPSRDDLGIRYITDAGTRVGTSSENITITPRREQGQPATIPFKDISHMTVTPYVQLSGQLIASLLDTGRSVSWVTGGGRYLGGAHPPLVKNFHLRKKQYEMLENDPQRLSLARAVNYAKLMNCRTLLRRNEAPTEILGTLRQLLRKAHHADSLAELLGIEGSAAKLYFPAFGTLLANEETFRWIGRTRRPPRDPLNALLSMAYSLLTRDMETAVRNTGLDPQAGFYHAAEGTRPALALDLMEPFRSLIADSVVLRCINSGVIQPDDFTILPAHTALNGPGRKRFFQAYEQRMNETVRHPRFSYSISYRRILELEARLFARHLEGELPDYTPLMTR